MSVVERLGQNEIPLLFLCFSASSSFSPGIIFEISVIYRAPNSLFLFNLVVTVFISLLKFDDVVDTTTVTAFSFDISEALTWPSISSIIFVVILLSVPSSLIP